MGRKIQQKPNKKKTKIDNFPIESIFFLISIQVNAQSISQVKNPINPKISLRRHGTLPSSISISVVAKVVYSARRQQ